MVRREQSAESEASAMIQILVPRTGVELIGLDAIAKHFGYQNIDVLANHLEIDMVVLHQL